MILVIKNFIVLYFIFNESDSEFLLYFRRFIEPDTLNSKKLSELQFSRFLLYCAQSIRTWDDFKLTFLFVILKVQINKKRIECD